jgi:hypothetical protein
MKKLRKSAWFVTWLLCTGLALGHTSNHPPVVPGSERLEWDPSLEERLSAVLVLSDNAEDVISSWATQTVSVPVRAVDTIARGVPIVALVFFTGCRPDENGLCNASADFTILRPDGSVYAEFADRDLWKRKPAPPDGTLRLSAEYVGAIIEPDDPLGRYEVQVSVHDLNAGTTLELRKAFTATAR